MLTDIFRQVDIPRLAGLSSILGIDVTGKRAHVVELRKKGNPFQRYSAEFIVGACFSCEFQENSTASERGEVLKGALGIHKVRAKHAVTTIQTMGVKVITATIPPGTENLESWILEHLGKLMRLPIAARDVSFRYQVLDESRSGVVVEIIFAKNADIEELITLITGAGVELVSLGGGSGDVIAGLAIGMPARSGENSTIIHLGNEILTIIPTAEGKRIHTQVIALTPEEDCLTVLESAVEAQRVQAGEGETVYIAGDWDERSALERYEKLTPFGLETEFALAAALAAKGFLPELCPVNFLSAAHQERIKGRTYKSLAQRMALVLGSVMFVLLSLQFATSFYIGQRMEFLDEEAQGAGSEYAEVTALEKQVSLLESKLQGGPASLQRTKVARVLHDLAGAAPEGIRLQKLSIGEKGQISEKLVLLGYASSSDLITKFLRGLESKGICHDVKLVRAGTMTEQQGVMSEPMRISGVSAFEIQATVKTF